MKEIAYKKEIGISFLIFLAFYTYIRVYKYFNPFDFPELENKILFILIPLGIITLLFWLPYRLIANISKKSSDILSRRIEKMNEISEKATGKREKIEKTKKVEIIAKKVVKRNYRKVSLLPYKKDIAILFLSMLVCYLGVKLYTSINKISLKGLEEKIFGAAVILGIIILLLMWLIFKFMPEAPREKVNIISNKKIEKKPKRIAKSHRIKDSINFLFSSLLSMLRLILRFILMVMKNQSNHQLYYAALRIIFLLTIILLLIFRGFSTVIVLAFVFSGFEAYLALANRRHRTKG
ncbi:MAG: hypothetical protein L6408_08075 [Nanoarchaeota archaeon]|nr:hypothetical protein [Nanoarchaeota archaeon]